MSKTKAFALALFSAILAVVISYLVFHPQAIVVPDNPEKDKICQDYANENMSTLDADLVHEMTESYRANQWSFINTNNNTKTTNDAYSIWFDLETLKKFLYHIEKISKENEQAITNDKLGVRIYYAAYPEKNVVDRFRDSTAVIDPTYIGLHTLVMIPTIKDSLGDIADFNPLDKDTYANGLAKVEKYRKNHPGGIPNNTAALTGTASSRHTGARNHGVLYPPTGNVTALGF